MLRSTLLLAFVLLGTTSLNASSAEIELAYKGVVTRSSGPHASSFVPGQAVTFRYILETTAADENPDASQGVFRNGLRRLQVTIPGAGVDAVTGNGVVQTFNGVSGSDQVFIYGATSQGQLAGLPITNAEVDFLDSTSSMIASDALPTNHLLTTDSFALLYTSAGLTFVNFLAEADKLVATCASKGYLGGKLTLCRQICEIDQTPTRLLSLIRLYRTAYREDPPCAL